MDLEKVERRLRARLDALPPPLAPNRSTFMMLPDLERVERIGEFW